MILYIKAFHIIFVVCWFAGIFYLPRLFVYHAMSEHAETRAQLSIMERKLFRFVTPFAVLSVLFGVALTLSNPSYYWSAPWMWLKLIFVVPLWTPLILWFLGLGVCVLFFKDWARVKLSSEI